MWVAEGFVSEVGVGSMPEDNGMDGCLSRRNEIDGDVGSRDRGADDNDTLYMLALMFSCGPHPFNSPSS